MPSRRPKASSHRVSGHRPLCPPTLRWFNHFALKLKCNALATRRKRLGPRVRQCGAEKEGWGRALGIDFRSSCCADCGETAVCLRL